MPAKYVVAPLSQLPPGSRLLVQAAGRPIAIFNSDGRLFAVSNRCPHAGGELIHGKLCGLVEAKEPGSYSYSRRNEILRCPWHGWEFDIATGKSWCDPETVRVKSYPVEVAPGAALSEAPLTLETFEVSVENDYVVVTV